MGENINSFFDKILLKSIDEEIAIDMSFIDTPAKNLPITTRTSTVSKLENYIDKKYDKTVESRQKSKILIELTLS